MAEPWKNAYDRSYLEHLADAFVGSWPQFPSRHFVAAVLGGDWAELELKARTHRIAECLREALPSGYRSPLKILRRTAPSFDGHLGMFLPAFVELFGLEDWDASLPALADLTRYSSSEFAVRPFIISDGARMMAQMLEWAGHENEHVRRLSSEGCRPRLPWGVSLPEFKRDPSPILPILERLREDPSEYVRRSVANNLNDIAKDHPALVRETAKRWLDETADVKRLVKHACRTLLKRGDTDVLRLFGFRDPKQVAVKGLSIEPQELRIGERVEFRFLLQSRQPLGKIRLEYAIDYRKSRGNLSRKIFQLSEFETSEKEREVVRRHAFIDRSTRRHFPGEHRLAVIVNGVEKARCTLFIGRTVPGQK
jgi:3-methyladenine DNA glycosylase AlkC